MFFFSGVAIACDERAFDLKKYNLEKEKILNVAINSELFAKGYGSADVVFEENELLSVDSPIVLMRKGRRVRIERTEDIGENTFVVLGDFTMARNDPVRARVQIEIPKKIGEVLLNFTFVKDKGVWKVEHSLLMED